MEEHEYNFCGLVDGNGNIIDYCTDEIVEKTLNYGDVFVLVLLLALTAIFISLFVYRYRGIESDKGISESLFFTSAIFLPFSVFFYINGEIVLSSILFLIIISKSLAAIAIVEKIAGVVLFTIFLGLGLFVYTTSNSQNDFYVSIASLSVFLFSFIFYSLSKIAFDIKISLSSFVRNSLFLVFAWCSFVIIRTYNSFEFLGWMFYEWDEDYILLNILLPSVFIVLLYKLICKLKKQNN